jgi:hypothetical protein
MRTGLNWFTAKLNCVPTTGNIIKTRFARCLISTDNFPSYMTRTCGLQEKNHLAAGYETLSLTTSTAVILFQSSLSYRDYHHLVLGYDRIVCIVVQWPRVYCLQPESAGGTDCEYICNLSEQRAHFSLRALMLRM